MAHDMTYHWVGKVRTDDQHGLTGESAQYAIPYHLGYRRIVVGH